MKLKGLEGIEGVVDALFVTTVDEAMRSIDDNDAVTSAGATGAVNIWKSSMPYRAEFARRCVVVHSIGTSSEVVLRRFLKRHWSMLGAITGDSE